MINGAKTTNPSRRFFTPREWKRVVEQKIKAERNMKLIEESIVKAKRGERGVLEIRYKRHERIYSSAIDRIVNAYQSLFYSKVEEYSGKNPDLPRIEIESEFNFALYRSAKGYIFNKGACFYTFFDRLAYFTICNLRKKHIKSTKREISLDADYYKNSIDNSHAFIEDTQAENPSESSSTKSNEDFLSDLMNILSQKERYIIENRYGLNGKVPRTLEEVARMIPYGEAKTRERMRQVQNIALSKLRKGIRRKIILQKREELKDLY